MSDETPRVPDFVEDTPVEETQPVPVVEANATAPAIVDEDDPILEAAEPVVEPKVVAAKCPVCSHQVGADKAGLGMVCPNCSQGVEAQPVLG